MNRRHAVILAIALALFAARDVSSVTAQTRTPNIVVIMADDMGFECLSCYGSDTYRTPHLDQLAKDGMRFEHCHSQPICTPSRVQIMTGIYNNRNYLQFGLLDPRATTFGHVLKQAGYKTCIVGKWQLRGGFEGPHKFGFDEYSLWQLTRRPSRYVNPGLETNGEEFDYTQGEYGPDLVSDYLCDFMERHKDGPFFAYYPMILPHWPFEPTPDSPDYDKASKGLKGTGKNQYFKDMVAYTDKMVGKVVDKLDALGIRKNTVVIFTGDNGTYTGITSRVNGRDYQGGKGSTRDNGTHVAMIASWPGTTPAGVTSDALIDFSDILPTIAELGSARVPKNLQLRGHSFAPLLRGEAFQSREFIYCWYERNGVRGKESQHVRNRTYKLYGSGKLYDVVADSAESKPLDPQSIPPDQYALLKAALDDELAITAAATPLVNQYKATGKKKAKNPKSRNPKSKNQKSKPAK